MCGDMISREHQVSCFARVGKLKTQGDFIKVAPCKFHSLISGKTGETV